MRQWVINVTKKELIEELVSIPDDHEIMYELINEDGSSTLHYINIIGYIDYSENFTILQK